MFGIEEYLVEHARCNGERIALVQGDVKISYSHLHSLCKARSEEFKSQFSNTIVIRASQDISFVVDYFAAHMAKKVFVPLEKDLPDGKFEEITQIVSGNYIPDRVTDILFTTGTTGKQKGVMISDLAIVSNAENLIEAQGFCQETTFIISGPLNHIGSLSKIWPIIIVGGTLIITDGMKDVASFFNALSYESNKFATFLVPASLRMLLRFERSRLVNNANKFDFIETGAAPLSKEDMLELCKVFPNTRLYNTYASTETGIVCTHNYNTNAGCIDGCVGTVMKHSIVFITNDDTIACKGPTLMSGYVGDTKLTHEILRNDTIYTSDIGYFDSSDRLILRGRNGDVINIGGYKVMPVEVENVVMAFGNISDCICVRSDHPVIGNVLKLLYVSDNDSDFDQKALVKYLKRNLESYKVPFFYEKTDNIARTYNGKLNRKFYE